MPTEITAHIRGIVEMEQLGNLFRGQVGGNEQSFHLHDDMSIDQLLGRYTQGLESDLREVVRRDAQFVGIKPYVVLRAAVLYQQPAERVEQPASLTDRLDVSRRYRRFRCCFHGEEKVLQLIAKHYISRFIFVYAHAVVVKACLSKPTYGTPRIGGGIQDNGSF